MKKAKIYTETTLKGPSVKDGAYGAVIEYILKDGKTVTKGFYRIERNTTHHRSALQAILLGLSRFRERCEIELVTGDVFIANSINQERPKNWSRQEWKNSKSEEVKNKDLWQQFLEELDKHEITVVFSKTNIYSKEMVANMQKQLKDAAKKSKNIENTERRGK